MLNELITASRSIQAAGISPYEWDALFVVLPKVTKSSPCFCIELNECGCPIDIRKLPEGSEQYLHRWANANAGRFFPGFNAIPLVYASDDEWQQAMSNGTVDSLVSQRDCLDDAKKIYAQCIGIQGTEFLNRIGEDIDSSCVRKLADAVRNFTVETFCTNLKKVILAKINAGCNDFDTLLVSHLKTKKERAAKKVNVFLETVGADGNRLATEEAMRLLNDRLIAAAVADSVEVSGLDAFGVDIEGVAVADATIPPVDSIPKLGTVLLRSMAGSKAGDGSPCQDRYGLSGGHSYPLSRASQSDARKALKWLCAPERHGLTWESLGPSELVFAYAKNFEKSPLARMFASVTGKDVVSDETSFAVCAKDVFSMLRGDSSTDGTLKGIVVFALKKADRSSARRKVVFYRDYTEANLRRSVQAWINGASNLPDIKLQRWPEKADATSKGEHARSELCELVAPYPLSVVPIAYTVWSSDSHSKQDAHSRRQPVPKFKELPACQTPPLFDGLDILFEDGLFLDSIRRLLSYILKNGGSMLVAAANACHKGEVLTSRIKVNKMVVNTAFYVQSVLPIIGILLYKLSIRKEKYMNETPYMLGKILNLADGLHRLWCECVKGNDPLPPVLLGNSFYTAVSQSPVQGVASLGARLRVYLAWAKSCQGEKAGLAHWYLKELSAAGDLIHQKGLPQRMTDTDKAQMLLGYMSSLKSKDDAEGSESESPNL